MTPTRPSRGSSHGSDSPGSFRDSLPDAIQFWEPRRIGYNLALVGLAIAWVLLTWPHFRPAFTLQSLLKLLILATLANLCYCAAYLVDILVQHSAFRGTWQQRLWGLWLAGTVFAVLLASYWIADEIYPFVN